MKDLVPFLAAHGLWAIFFVTLVARIGAPVPAAPLLVVVGALGQSGVLPLWAAAAVSVLANLAGDAVWFVAGRRWGYRVLRFVCRVSLSPDSCVGQSETMILRWGGPALVAAKFVPGVSVVAAPMAGALAMSWPRFVFFVVLGGAAWTMVFLGAGAVFSASVGEVLRVLAASSVLAFVVLALLAAAFVAWRWWRRREFRRMVDVPRIGPDELRSLLGSGADPLIVDVRSAASVQLDPRTITGAIPVELGRIEALAHGVPPDREVVLYCNCPNEASAAKAAVLLARNGVRRARPLAGGLDAWFMAEEGSSSAAPGPGLSWRRTPDQPRGKASQPSY
jgi:membrane protein DedA with SNARE-associated domain/rhodanese-related sulfurtransferase